MKIIPWDKRVYVKLDKVEEKKSEGGILLPDKHSEESRLATILAIGDMVNEERTRRRKWFQIWKRRKWIDGTEIKPGQRIVVQFYAGISLHMVTGGMLDDTRRLITESNILCLVEEEDG
jgi:co-chaperonin GroES (HSP10)